MKSPFKYKVIGLMSGTSLDGLDLVYCEFAQHGKKWIFNLKANETKKYNAQWHEKLSKAHLLPGEDLQLLDNEFGFFIGNACVNFVKRYKINHVDFIASHGHTIFHQPEKKLTLQLGNGTAINAASQLPVVNDFRSLDILKGGQGAPLVPIGDHFLFSQYDVCLNLGGIANLSKLTRGKRIAFDICFANMGLNYLAGKMQQAFDKNGGDASKGSINEEIFTQLRACYKRWEKTRPSLGREGFERFIIPILDNESVSIQNRLRSFCESICIEIASCIPVQPVKIKLLVTGGGALNNFLIALLRKKIKSNVDLVVPESAIINYKEAIVFAFLGVLRTRNEVNVLKTVTGASTDSCAGVMIGF